MSGEIVDSVGKEVLRKSGGLPPKVQKIVEVVDTRPSKRKKRRHKVVPIHMKTRKEIKPL